MMQFSVSAGRVLDPVHLAATLGAVRLHERLEPELVKLAEHAARTGEPILRPLANQHSGFENVSDQFLLGGSLVPPRPMNPGRHCPSPVSWQQHDLRSECLGTTGKPVETVGGHT